MDRKYFLCFSLVFGNLLVASKQQWISFTNDFISYNNTGQLPEIASEYQKYCPANDLCTAPQVSIEENCCGRCSCRRDCYQTGNCCPDVLQYFNEELHQTCFRPQYFDYGVTNVSASFSLYMVHRCPAEFSDTNLKSKCEIIPETANTLDEFYFLIPFSKVNSSVTYRNLYCGLCNGESNATLIRWKIELRCSTRKEIKTNSFDELLLILNRDKNCNILFSVPQGFRLFSKICQWGHVTKCNQTGDMLSYSTSVSEQCGSFTSLYRKYYRNVFCFLCNSNEDPAICDIDPPIGGIDTAAFNAILDFDVFSYKPQYLKTNANQFSCIDNQMYDHYKAVCRNITCQTGAVYLDGECKMQYEQQSKRSYDVFFMVRPTRNKSICLSIDDFTGNQLSEAIQSSFEVQSQILSWVCYNLPLFKSDQRNCFDNRTSVAYFLVHMDFFVKFSHSVDQYIKEVLYLDNKAIVIGSNNFSVHVDSRNFGNIEFGSEPSTRHYTDPDTKSELSIMPGPLASPWCAKLRHLRVTKLTQCPRLLMDITEYTTKVSNDSVCFPEIDLCLKDGSYEKVETGYEICADVYFKKTNNMTVFHKTNQCNNKPIVSFNDLKIVSTICTLVSIFTLFLTILTYSLFKSLRSVPGINNMLLSIAFLTSQMLYFFGIAQTHLGVTCAVIGIFIHYCWLSTILWMNVCSFHMFRVFSVKVKRPNTKGKDKNIIIKYCIYAGLVPIIPVLTNISLNLVWSDWTDVGYGGCLCYITSTMMILFTFAIPVAILLLLNVVFFVTVVISIRRTQNSTLLCNKDQISVTVYLKLSCVTGAYWVFGFLQNWLDYDIIRYLFIFLGAGQGLFIFMSFICSKRVLNLYLQLFKCDISKLKQHPSLSATGSYTLSSTTSMNSTTLRM